MRQEADLNYLKFYNVTKKKKNRNKTETIIAYKYRMTLKTTGVRCEEISPLLLLSLPYTVYRERKRINMSIK